MRDIKRTFSAVLADSTYKYLIDEELRKKDIWLFKNRYSYAILRRNRKMTETAMYVSGSISFKKNLNDICEECIFVFNYADFTDKNTSPIKFIAIDYTEDNKYEGVLRKLKEKCDNINMHSKHRL